MDFVFETLDNGVFLNFLECTDINTSGIRRFTASPLITELEQLNSSMPDLNLNFSTNVPTDKTYVIPSGVAHSPDFWTGKFDKTPSKKSVLDWLPQRYKNDLKNKKAFLLLDQSHEGYQEIWLWDWIHQDCLKHEIDPRQLIYVTGNMQVTDQYKEWADNNGIINRIYTVPYPHFEFAVSSSSNDHLPAALTHFKLKTKNIKNIKLYNCLQKRPRNHRIWLFTKLYENNLLDYGINSMNSFEFHKTYMDGKNLSREIFDACSNLLPMLPPGDSDKLAEFESGDCGDYLMKFNHEIMLESLLSLISEASFDDTSHTTFLSEKTFKTIMCAHPFIIFGNKYSLKHLQNLGYKTFSPFINEDYDNLSNWERLDHILNELIRLKSMSKKEKIKFITQITPIVKFNQEHLRKRKSIVSKEIKNLLNYLERP